jgi:SanA protein
MRKRKIILLTLGVLTFIIVLITWLCNRAIDNAAKGKLYSDTGNIPYNKVGLLLGTSRTGRHGHLNAYYSYRIQAAAQLIKEGKIKYLVISGDNSRKEYNEPELMRADLIKAGIDSTIIYLDYAGFRTFDSIVRLKEIFGQASVTIISQPFHNERAIYIASKEGIAAIGFNAKDVNTRYGFKTQLREKLARVKVFADYLFSVKPKYLGDKIPIPS